MAIKNYSNWTREELVRELKKVAKRKKYGVVWDEEKNPEEVVELCKEQLPILKEVENKEIKNGKKNYNILIQGDNYHSLSVLNYTHRGKIDVIYIDPPYNTGGKDFMYNDSYVDSEDSYRHSKWLNFMGKRLKLAKNLLKNTGVIFISIDENEFAQLKLLCDEIFGEKNNVGTVIVKSNPRGKQQMKIAMSHEYLLVYAKRIDSVHIKGLDLSEKELVGYNKTDNDGKKFREMGLRKRGAASRRVDVPNLYYPIYVNPDTGETSLKKNSKFTKEALPVLSNGVEGRWRWSKKKFEQDKGRLFGRLVNGSRWDIFERDYLIKEGNQKLMKAKSIWDEKEINYENATKELKALFDGKSPFAYPKTLFLMKKILNISLPKNGKVLDFFAGSGTMGHAALELNHEDGGERTFILCTNNESNNGSGKIATDICYPRIKKASKGYVNSNGEKIDGFGGNLKYFETSFVEAKQTDMSKKELVDQSTEVLCIKENCFEKIKEGKEFKIFKNNKEKYLGIVYDDDGIEPIKKEIKKIGKKFNLYVFSLDSSAREEEFEEVIDLVGLRPIPEVILNVYRRIFK